MSASYKAVQWNKHKLVYDVVLVAGIVLYLAVYVIASSIALPGANAITPPILLLQATGTLAFVMLHIVLCIGPLTRLDRRFMPLLYNRRHFGVALFCVACVHAGLVMLFYHGFSSINPLVSLFTSNTQYDSLHSFPFEILGVGAFLILFVMAATSHDFWLANLKPAVWKAIHMLVYVAYGLLVMHVVLGALQSKDSMVYPVLTFAGLAVVAGLHIAAGLKSRLPEDSATDGWIEVGSLEHIPNERAKVVQVAGCERIAVFKHDGNVSAVSNVCAHQGGPLGEGKVVDGCITCPWHGYQYKPEDGQSPPPYTEKINTYEVRIENKRVLVNPEPLSPGTRLEPAVLEQASAEEAQTGRPSQ